MNISKITYKQNFAYNPISMEHIHLGVEIDINEGESASEAFTTAKNLINETYQAIIKDLPVPMWEDSKLPEQKIEPASKPNQEQSIIRDISSVTDLKVLESYKLIAKNNPNIQIAYDNKLNELTP